MASVIFTVPK